jgi:aryl-alcohol dehydrogenase-like predicted oxidoreductase
MTKQKFGNTGMMVSPLGYGAAEVAYLKTDESESASMIEALLDAGLNVLDTAASYPGSEEFIGKRLSHRRSDYVLISKLGQKIPESDAEDWSGRLVLDSIERSLRLLKTDRIDAMLLHSCNRSILEKGEAVDALDKARAAGKIRFAGYSGDNDAAAYAATLNSISVIETSISIVDQINIDLVLPKALQRGVGVIAKRPIANAAWKQLAQQPGMYQSYAKVYTDRFPQLKLSPSDLGFDGAPEKAWPEIAIRFTLSQPGVHTAIIGTTRHEHALSNISHAAKGPLSPDVVEKIRSAYKRADPNRQWRGQT